jgi:hypothetical protein
VQQEEHQQVNGGPGGVEEGEDAVAGQKLANVGEIRESLYRVVPALIEMGFEAGIEYPAVQRSSMRTPRRTRRRERDHSAKAITEKRNNVIAETTTRVSSLPRS